MFDFAMNESVAKGYDSVTERAQMSLVPEAAAESRS